MSAIEACRTAELGGHVERCEDCAHTRVAYNSCRNRHCPKCQWTAAQAWLEAREAELLPAPYFHVVFTLPAKIGAIAYHNKAKELQQRGVIDAHDLVTKIQKTGITHRAGDPNILAETIYAISEHLFDLNSR